MLRFGLVALAIVVAVLGALMTEQWWRGSRAVPELKHAPKADASTETGSIQLPVVSNDRQAAPLEAAEAPSPGSVGSGPLTFTVQDERGAPQMGVTVVLLGGKMHWTATSESNGAARFEQIPSGQRYEVRLQSPFTLLDELSVASPPPSQPVVLTCRQFLTRFVGRVIDDEGKPVASATVLGDVLAGTKTDGDGGFILLRYPEDAAEEFSIQVVKRGFLTTKALLRWSEGSAEITMNRGATIDLTVRAAGTNEILGGYQAYVLRPDCSTATVYARGSLSEEAVGTGATSLSLPGLEAGHYCLRVLPIAGTAKPWMATDRPVYLTTGVYEVTVTAVDAPATVIVVKNEAGAPVSGARVEAKPVLDLPVVPPPSDVSFGTTDAEGSTSLNLAASACSLKASAEGYQPVQLRLDGAAAPAHLEIVLPTAFAVFGELEADLVRLLAEFELVDCVVLFAPKAGSALVQPTSAPLVDGRFECELPAGEYTVELQWVHRRPGALEGGGRVELGRTTVRVSSEPQSLTLPRSGWGFGFVDCEVAAEHGPIAGAALMTHRVTTRDERTREPLQLLEMISRGARGERRQFASWLYTDSRGRWRAILRAGRYRVWQADVPHEFAEFVVPGSGVVVTDTLVLAPDTTVPAEGR